MGKGVSSASDNTDLHSAGSCKSKSFAQTHGSSSGWCVSGRVAPREASAGSCDSSLCHSPTRGTTRAAEIIWMCQEPHPACKPPIKPFPNTCYSSQIGPNHTMYMTLYCLNFLLPLDIFPVQKRRAHFLLRASGDSDCWHYVPKACNELCGAAKEAGLQ